MIRGSLSIQDTLGQRNTCQFSVRVDDGTGGAGNRLTVGELVQIIDKAGEDQIPPLVSLNYMLFGGLVDRIDEYTRKGTTEVIQKITLVDYNSLLDRYLVAAVYTNETAGDIVRDIFTDSLGNSASTASDLAWGVTAVEDGPVIRKAVFNYVTVAEAMLELQDITGYAFHVDYLLGVHFYDRVSNPVSVTFNGQTTELTVTRDRERYRNRQIVRAGMDLTASRVESFKGDGTLEAFVLKYPAGTEPTIKVNAVTKTVGIRGLESGKDWYWNKGDPIITQDDAGTTLTSSDTLEVTYQGLYPVVISVDASPEILAQDAIENWGGNGIYEHVRDDPSLEGREYAQDLATGLLRRYACLNEAVTLNTNSMQAFIDAALGVTWYPYMLRAGDLITIQDAFGGSPLQLDDTYLIEECIHSEYDGATMATTIRARKGEAYGGWAQFFRELQKRPGLQIRENEVLVLVRNFTESLLITEDLVAGGSTTENRIGFATVGFSQVA